MKQLHGLFLFYLGYTKINYGHGGLCRTCSAKQHPVVKWYCTLRQIAISAHTWKQTLAHTAESDEQICLVVLLQRVLVVVLAVLKCVRFVSTATAALLLLLIQGSVGAEALWWKGEPLLCESSHVWGISERWWCMISQRSCGCRTLGFYLFF